MKKFASSLMLSCAVLVANAALAHNVSIEPQARYPIPLLAPPQADYSWSHPRVLSNVVDSQAIFSYLSIADVDVYSFQVTAADLATGPVLVSAAALPPACLEYQFVYPVVALVGPQAPSPFGPPGLPAPAPGLNLPFTVPAGQGVVFANNPHVPFPARREIFELEGDLGLSWFLPLGLSQHCLLEAQYLCDFSNTVAQPVFYPGTYYIAIWNPTGIPTDYTANIGYSEANYTPNPEAEELLRDNALLHRSCHEPYSWP